MKRLIPVLMILCLLLVGCGGADSASTTGAPTTEATTEATTAPTTEPVTEPVTEPTEPPVLYRHPLTGEPLDEPFTVRPTAIVINNIRYALPHHGVAQADVIYEIMAEGGITRCLAIYTDFSEVGNIGSIRSARTYMISLAANYNAVLIHNGDSTFARQLFNTGLYDHVDGEYPYFFRDQDRLNAGLSVEHTLFTTGELMDKCVNTKFDMVADEDAYYGFDFDEDVVLDGEEAETITVKYSVGGKTTELTYDPEQGTYTMYQHDRDYVDGNTGEKVEFTNVFVLYAKMTNSGDSSGHVFHELEGENVGYYACGGQIVPIKWSRQDENHPFQYTLEDGTPVTMTPGTTYICIVPGESTVNYQ